MTGVGVLALTGVFEILKDILAEACTDEDLAPRAPVCSTGLGVLSLGVFTELPTLDGVLTLGTESLPLVCGGLLNACGLFGVDGPLPPRCGGLLYTCGLPGVNDLTPLLCGVLIGGWLGVDGLVPLCGVLFCMS